MTEHSEQIWSKLQRSLSQENDPHRQSIQEWQTPTALSHARELLARLWGSGTSASEASSAHPLQYIGVLERQAIGRALRTTAYMGGSEEEVVALRKRVNTLEQQMAEMRGMVAGVQTAVAAVEREPIIELRDISYEDAKAEIKQYVVDHHGEDIDASDIQDTLGIDIRMAIQVCNELEKEGQIKGL